MKLLLFPLLTICLLAGCKKEEPKCTVQCTPIAMSIGFTNDYTVNERDTIIERRFTPDGTFSQLIVQTIHTTADTEPMTWHDATSVVYKHWPIAAGYDYEIQIPGAGQTVRITNVVKPQKSEEQDCNNSTDCYVATQDLQLSGGSYDKVFARDYYTILLKK